MKKRCKKKGFKKGRPCHTSREKKRWQLLDNSVPVELLHNIIVVVALPPASSCRAARRARSYWHALRVDAGLGLGLRWGLVCD